MKFHRKDYLYQHNDFDILNITPDYYNNSYLGYIDDGVYECNTPSFELFYHNKISGCIESHGFQIYTVCKNKNSLSQEIEGMIKEGQRLNRATIFYRYNKWGVDIMSTEPKKMSFVRFVYVDKGFLGEL